MRAIYLSLVLLCGSLSCVNGYATPVSNTLPSSMEATDRRISESRMIVQRLVQNNSAVMQQFDAFATALIIEAQKNPSLSEEDIFQIMNGVEFAAEEHRFQRRNDAVSTPYIIHPLGVAENLLVIGNIHDPEIIIAALLHDTVEDTPITSEEIEQKFGKQVADYVRELTDDPCLPRAKRLQKQIENAPHKSQGAAAIKLADRLDNLRGHLFNSPDWTKSEVDAYFQSSRDLVKALPPGNDNLKEAVNKLIDLYQKHPTSSSSS